MLCLEAVLCSHPLCASSHSAGTARCLELYLPPQCHACLVWVFRYTVTEVTSWVMTETIAMISLGVRTLNAVVLVVLALIPVFLYREQYKVSEICTAYDTPVGCSTKGGRLRALDMISPTTSLYFDDKPSTLYPAVPYHPSYNNATLPFSSQQAYCISHTAQTLTSSRPASCRTCNSCWRCQTATSIDRSGR